MAHDLQVRLYTGAGDYIAIGVLGSWSWRQEMVYRETASASPELSELVETWTVDGLFRSSDGTAATGWTEYKALRARWMVSGATQPERMEIVRDPDAASPVVELTLGPPDYEEFRLEDLSGAPWTEAPAASFRQVFPISLSVSAVRKFASSAAALADVVAWEQSVTTSYTGGGGLKELTWSTDITSKEGTDAIALAQSYAAIPLSAIGANYSIVTNGPHGVDVEVLDANETLGRTATQVRAVSAIREHGVGIGLSGYGSSPDDVGLECSDNVQGSERVRTTAASATGPGARTWCEQHKPTWAQDEERSEDKAGRGYRIAWTARTQSDKRDIADFWKMRIDLSGGARQVSFEPVSGGLPIMFTGARTPYQAALSVVVERRGGYGTRASLPFPPLLPSPWVLIENESTESEPELTEAGTTDEADKWARSASLVYRSASKPPGEPLKYLRENAARRVESYLDA